MSGSERCLHEVFAGIARLYPDRIAVKSHGGFLTYRELACRAEAVAVRLRIHGVGPEVLVGLATDRDEHMIVGMLAILMAGGAYVPLDPDYPRERLAYLIADSRVSLVVTAGASALALPEGVPVLCIDQECGELPAASSFVAPEVASSNAAYVIYTSGSTGAPKGVVVEHRNVVRLFTQTAAQYRFGPEDVWTMFHSFGFDFSVWEIWGALLYGGRVVIVPFGVTRSPSAFRALLLSEGVTRLSQTPSAFRQLITAELDSPKANHALQTITFGGEALDPQMLAPWVERYGDEHPRLINMYGITETTVHVTYREIRRHDLNSGLRSIGTPIGDLYVRLLDPQGEPTARGETGEIYVGGRGVARGYLNRPVLTEQRFVRDHHTDEAGARLYRSGDRARYDENGDLIYVGRVDDQLKVRGFRIEPGEIEACLRANAAVSACAVVAADYAEGDVRLVAYYVAQPGTGEATAVAAELAVLAARQLPIHMRPSSYVQLAELPLTAHGKLDRKALPAPPMQDRAVNESEAERGETARTETELRLTQMWERMLSLRGIAPKDDFFDLGGTSLALIRLLREINQGFGVQLDIAAVLDGVTIENFARQLGPSKTNMSKVVIQ